MSKKTEEEASVPEAEQGEGEMHVPDNLLVSSDWEVVRQLVLPEKAREPRGSKYPMHSLEVGDAIITTTQNSKNVAVAARSYAKRTEGWRFITRSLGDGKSAILRVS